MAFRRNNNTAIVLAGGSSTRMGRPKALLNFGGISLIERVVHQLRPVTEDIRIITNTPELYTFLNLPMHADFIPDSGPLAGIFTGLAITRSEPVIVMACDTPFITTEYFFFLLDQWSDKISCLIPKIGRFYEPLAGLYSHRAMPVIEELLKSGNRKIESLFDRVPTKTLSKRDLAQFGDLRKFFWNINDPEGYEEALKQL
ncbi:MAG: molybdenum cofactor guanylyltransferase [Calditrichaeota bacterium]|nr:molybdenum cofactor guanylyltransferase [Calditrichota bacterium]